MSSYDIDLDDPPERWRELFARIEGDADDPVPPPVPPAQAPVALEEPGGVLALYVSYLAGES